MKTKSLFKCQICSYQTPKWQGKCPECNSWNSLVEEAAKVPSNNLTPSLETKNPVSLEEFFTTHKDNPRVIYEFSTNLLNDFWNGGITGGSLTLLAGEPGLGKSTLALQLLRALSKTTNKTKK